MNYVLIIEVMPGVRDIPRAMESSPIRPTLGSIQHAECSVRAERGGIADADRVSIFCSCDYFACEKTCFSYNNASKICKHEVSDRGFRNRWGEVGCM